MIDREIKKYIVSPHTALKQVIGGLYKYKLHIALVCDRGEHIVGIATLGDIKQAINTGMDPNEQVAMIMNRDFVWTNENVSVASLQEMSKVPRGASRSIPILNNTHEAVGIYNNTETGFRHKTVLVTGGAGYVGSILCRKLLAKGYRVIVLDKLDFGIEPIQDLLEYEQFKFIMGDTGNINTLIKSIKDADYVIHLAGVVGDPASSIDPIYTLESNYFSTQTLIELSKYFQVSRFIFASSCSVYGARDSLLTELSPLKPVSLYARSKIASEKELLKSADEYFHPTILRFGTLYGLSQRMRFDLVANIMTAHAFYNNEIQVNCGDQWRPLLHVSDAAQACIAMLEEPIEKVRTQIFNIGANDHNFTINQIASTVKTQIPSARIRNKNTVQDKRNYRVSFDKVSERTHFKTEHTLTSGLQSIVSEMNSGAFKNFNDPLFNNYKYMQQHNNSD